MGKLALFCVAVSILCSLLTADNIPTDPKFDPAKVSGKWYPILTGSYHQPPPKKVFAVRLKPLGNGAFSANVEIPVNRTCQVLKYDLKPIKPGTFKTKDGKAFVHIIETDYNHNLLCIIKIDRENILQLFAKKPKVSLEWKKKFNHFAKELRYSTGKEQGLSHTALCVPPPKKKKE